METATINSLGALLAEHVRSISRAADWQPGPALEPAQSELEERPVGENAAAPWWVELFETLDGAADTSAYDGEYWSVNNGLGTRPALLVVDVVRSFIGYEGQTLKEASSAFPTACGPAAWAAIPSLRRAIGTAVANAWPIVYTTGLIGGASHFGPTVKGEAARTGPVMDMPGAVDIPDAVEPPADALVLAKPKASAFFDTPLLSFLIRQGVDSLVVTGTTTSGCVRATVTDAHSHGYPTFVVEEACFDRSRLSHAVNLFEMHAKYADVVTIADLELAASGRA